MGESAALLCAPRLLLLLLLLTCANPCSASAHPHPRVWVAVPEEPATPQVPRQLTVQQAPMVSRAACASSVHMKTYLTNACPSSNSLTIRVENHAISSQELTLSTKDGVVMYDMKDTASGRRQSFVVARLGTNLEQGRVADPEIIEIKFTFNPRHSPQHEHDTTMKLVNRGGMGPYVILAQLHCIAAQAKTIDTVNIRPFVYDAVAWRESMVRIINTDTSNMTATLDTRVAGHPLATSNIVITKEHFPSHENIFDNSFDHGYIEFRFDDKDAAAVTSWYDALERKSAAMHVDPSISSVPKGLLINCPPESSSDSVTWYLYVLPLASVILLAFVVLIVFLFSMGVCKGGQAADQEAAANESGSGGGDGDVEKGGSDGAPGTSTTDHSQVPLETAVPPLSERHTVSHPPSQLSGACSPSVNPIEGCMPAASRSGPSANPSVSRASMDLADGPIIARLKKWGDSPHAMHDDDGASSDVVSHDVFPPEAADMMRAHTAEPRVALHSVHIDGVPPLGDDHPDAPYHNDAASYPSEDYVYADGNTDYSQ